MAAKFAGALIAALISGAAAGLDFGPGVVVIPGSPGSTSTEGSFSVVLVSTQPISSAALALDSDPAVRLTAGSSLDTAPAMLGTVLRPSTFTDKGANRFLSLTVDPALGVLGSLPADRVPVRLHAVIRVTPPANARGNADVAWTLTISDASARVVRLLAGRSPVVPGTGPGNSTKAQATLDVAWNLDTDQGIRVPPGRYTLAFVGTVVSPGTSSAKVGNVVTATADALVTAGAGTPRAVAEVRYAATAPGLYPIAVAVDGAFANGAPWHTGAVVYADVNAASGELLAPPAAMGRKLKEQFDRVSLATPSGQTVDNALLVPMVLGDASSNAGTSVTDDIVARPGGGFVPPTPQDPLFRGIVAVTTASYRSAEPVPGLPVCVYHVGWFTDDLVGCTMTDDIGNYQVPFSSGGGDNTYYAIFRTTQSTFEVRFPDSFMAVLLFWGGFWTHPADAANIDYALKSTCGTSVWCARSPAVAAPLGGGDIVFNPALHGNSAVRTAGDLVAGSIEVHRNTWYAQRAYLRAGGRQFPYPGFNFTPPLRAVHFPTDFCEDYACAPPIDPDLFPNAMPIIYDPAEWTLQALLYWLGFEDWTTEIGYHFAYTQPDAPRHEYGHTVMYDTLGTLPMFSFLDLLCLSHGAGEDKSSQCALGEGWADFWENASSPRFPYGSNPVFPYGSMPVFQDESTLNPYLNLETMDTIEAHPTGGGHREMLVAAGLWDFIDEFDDVRPGEFGTGDLNRGHTIPVSTLLKAMRIAGVTGGGTSVRTFKEFSKLITSPFPLPPRTPLIDSTQWALAAEAAGHNFLDMDFPPPLPPPPPLTPPPLPTNASINPIAVITPPSPLSEPSPVGTGTLAFDSSIFGRALEANDIDGDGLTDLVVGAPGAVFQVTDSHGVAVSKAQSGAILLYIAGPTGYALRESATMLPRVDIAANGSISLPAGGALGGALALGDFDGGGVRDDVISLAHGSSSDFLFSFLNAGSGASLGVEIPTPSVFGAGSTFFADEVVALDVDGDGKDDAVVHGIEMNFASNLTTGSVVLIFYGGSGFPPVAAGATLVGRDSGPFGGVWTSTFGHSPMLQDVDGDGILDLVVTGGGSLDASTGGPGVASVFKGPILRGSTRQPELVFGVLLSQHAPLLGEAVLSGAAIGQGPLLPGAALSVSGAGLPVTHINLLAEPAGPFPPSVFLANATYVIPLPGNIDPFAPLDQVASGIKRARLLPALASSATEFFGLSAQETNGAVREIDHYGRLLTGSMTAPTALHVVEVPPPVPNGSAQSHAFSDFGTDFGVGADVSGDAIPDLVVSAPGESGFGVVWVFDGALVR
jgi:hypothetical protein